MLLLDLSHTSHTRARTGIQRVARSLHHHLAGVAEPITRDPFLRTWRKLEPWELANLADGRGGKKRGARWPQSAIWRGRLRRWLGQTRQHALQGPFEGFIAPEIFGPPIVRHLPELFQHVRGPRIALFHDAIPLRFPELTPPRTVARFPQYLQELLMFDGIAAISEESRDTLQHYWAWLGISDPPPVHALPVGVDLTDRRLPTHPPKIPAGKTKPVVLCVGTLEGRKNHLQLLNACEKLWSRQQSFELQIIGHVNETGRTALANVRKLQAMGRPVRYEGPGADEDIERAYEECAFTVYPSIAEGFGLPVIESLARGKPCICSGRGALGEISKGGGCIPLDIPDVDHLASAIASLLDSPARLSELAAAARARTFKSWADYSRELIAWMQSLRRR